MTESKGNGVYELRTTGDGLLEYRLANGWKREELAIFLDCDLSTVARSEQAKDKPVSKAVQKVLDSYPEGEGIEIELIVKAPPRRVRMRPKKGRR